MKKKLLSMILAAALCMGGLPTAAFATNGSAQDSGDPTIGTSGICEHHTAHDDTCGYIEGEEGAVCAYLCTECASQEDAPPSDPACVCESECGEGSVNAECPACSAEGADLSFCTGTKLTEELICSCETDDPAIHATTCPVYTAPENPECFCAEKCPDDAPNEWCDVCGVQGAAACKGGAGLAAAYEVYKYGDFLVEVTSGKATYDYQLNLTSGGKYTVSMKDGVTTSSLNIVVSGGSADTEITLNDVSCENLVCSNVGNVTVILQGENKLANISCDNTQTYASSLTVSGTGSLTATAGINGDNADITIESGTITATGGNGAAGIGGIYNSAAGIGGVYNGAGTVTINDGTITAMGGNGAAGIGGGHNAAGTVTVSGGTITATGGEYGAGIGGGRDGAGTVTINGGTITATGGYAGADIGGGYNGESDVTITGGAFTKTPFDGGYNPLSGVHVISERNVGGGVDVKKDATKIEAAGRGERLSVALSPDPGYVLTGLYLLETGASLPTAPYSIDTTVFTYTALTGGYDFTMPDHAVTIYAVFEAAGGGSGESYPVTTEVIGYDGARLYAYTGVYPYDEELNDAGAVSSAPKHSVVNAMLDASTAGTSINKLPDDYELVGLYLNPTAYPDSHYIDNEAFTSDYMSWGENYIYGGSYYSFMVLGPTHVVAVVAKTGESVNIPGYTIRYDAGEGSGEMSSGTAAQGALFTLPKCGFTPPDGYQFKAWSINGAEYAPGDGVRFDGDATVTALWKIPVKGIAVTTQPKLNYTGGESLDLSELEILVTYADGITELMGYNDVSCSPAHGTGLTKSAYDGKPVTVTFDGQTATTNALNIISTDAAITGVTVNGNTSTSTVDGDEVNILLPAGSSLPTSAAAFTAVTNDPDAKAVFTAVDASAGSWKLVVTAEDGTTKREYSLIIDTMLETKTEVSPLGDEDISDELKAAGYDTVEKIETALKSKITAHGIPANNTALYNIDLLYTTDGVTWQKADQEHFPANGKLAASIPAPADAAKYDFFGVHMFSMTAFGKTAGDTENISFSENIKGSAIYLNCTVTGLSPLLVGWKETGGSTGGTGGGSSHDDDSDSGSDYRDYEEEFWQQVREKIEEAKPGNKIIARARGYDRMPASVMKALRERGDVTLEIHWNGGDTITIPAGKALNEQNRVYYPLSYLEGYDFGDVLATSAAGRVNPNTGGPIEVTAPAMADTIVTPDGKPEVTGSGMGMAAAIGDAEKGNEQIIPGIADPEIAAPVADDVMEPQSRSGGSAGIWIFLAALAAAGGGWFVWRKRREKEEA